MKFHPLVAGVAEIANRHRARTNRDRLFQELYDCIVENWRRHREREPRRWPTAKNWTHRVAPNFTPHPKQRREKQLQKQIAICLRDDGWGNDMPTASGLVNSGGRQMNIDLVCRQASQFDLVELKLTSNTPYDAAIQILQYGAIYLLYRNHEELTELFTDKPVMHASDIRLKVLAPRQYYSNSEFSLRVLETELNYQLQNSPACAHLGTRLSFAFVAFPQEFEYSPGMDCAEIRKAVDGIAKLFQQPATTRGIIESRFGTAVI